MPPLVDNADMWAGDGDEEPERAHAHEELNREWRARREEFWNSGYREGLEAGKHDTVQEGFDQGYVLGTKAGYEWGIVRGAALTLQAAAAKGLMPAAAAAAAVEPINALAPGQVQNTVGRKLMQDQEQLGEENSATRGAEDIKIEQAQQSVMSAIAELGFTIDLKQADTTDKT